MPENDTDEFDFLDQRYDETFVKDTSELIKQQTYRSDQPDSEQRVTTNLTRIGDYLDQRVATINGQLKNLEIKRFDWKKEIKGAARWVFGYRVGTGKRKFAVLTHLDTVPPGGTDWGAFDPKITEEDYEGVKQKFLTGRGSIDDKGPSIINLTVLEAAAMKFDSTPEALKDWTLEATFDTSEETGATIPDYVGDPAIGAPEFGIVYDAFWCIKAEKGLEKPTFAMPVGTNPSSGLWIESLSTPPGPANQIPASASAVIAGSDAKKLAGFGAKIGDLYQQYGFDDPDYRRAPLEVETSADGVKLTTSVLGAQHGSAPEANRREGANPLVSLANFLAGLVDLDTVDGDNGYARMVKFMAWGWGTQVFGEKHPELLYRYDDFFEKGNGTTYALTRVALDDDRKNITLKLDIRYARGHHETQWDGMTNGLLPGTSLFEKSTFPGLLKRFQQTSPESELSFDTECVAAPDMRVPTSAPYRNIDKAFEKVVGKPCPKYAIGGGTDAKGFPTLTAAGALFSTEFGAPVNYHGIGEAAPIADLKLSARVLFEILQNAVASPTAE